MLAILDSLVGAQAPLLLTAKRSLLRSSREAQLLRPCHQLWVFNWSNVSVFPARLLANVAEWSVSFQLRVWIRPSQGL